MKSMQTENERIEEKAMSYLKKYCVRDECDKLTASAIRKLFGRLRRLERQLAKADNSDKEATNEN